MISKQQARKLRGLIVATVEAARDVEQAQIVVTSVAKLVVDAAFTDREQYARLKQNLFAYIRSLTV